MAENMCRSADLPLQNFLEASGEHISHHRMVDQELKCGFGLDGVCCKLCSNGPCRISKARPYGVCGADANTIVMRNFLRSVAAGSGCYIHVVENAAKRLKEAAKAGAGIKSEAALQRLCDALNINGQTACEKAERVADCVLADLRRPYEEQMELVEKLAYPARVETWKKLGLMPGGAKDEIFNAVVKTSTNLNSDPMNMLMQCLRLGISTGLYGLVLTNMINDVLMGEAEIGFDTVGLGTIDPEYINIMVTGHQHALFGNLTEMLQRPEINQLATMVGAKGIKIVGCTCVGQDFQVRGCNCKDVFCGHAGNNYTSEAIIMTGCIDLVVSEFNCTIPGLEPLCEKMEIPMICLDDVAKKKNATLLPYSDEDKEAISIQVLTASIAAYQNRIEKCTAPAAAASNVNYGCKGAFADIYAATAAKIAANHQEPGKRVNPMADHCKEAITGVTDVTLKNFLGGDYSGLIQLIASGAIKGVVGVVGCSNLRAQGHDVLTVELTKELIKRDILVLSAGCTSGGLENCGLMSREAAELAGPGLKAVCKTLGIPPVLNFGPCLAIGRVEKVASDLAAALGVDIPQLPVVVSAPQWLEEQALADGAFALAMGFHLHLGLPPFVTGSPLVVDVLTNQLPSLTGGRLMIETEALEAANRIEEVIFEKRKGLGL